MNFEKPKKSDFWKNEKNCWRYHFTHVYQKHNHLRYSSWDLECNRIFCYFGPFSSLLPRYGVWQIKLSFQAIFCSFNPLLTPKIKIRKKCKKTLDIYVLSFYTSVPKIKTIWCMVPEIWSAPDRIFCHLGPLFAPLPP